MIHHPIEIKVEVGMTILPSNIIENVKAESSDQQAAQTILPTTPTTSSPQPLPEVVVSSQPPNEIKVDTLLLQFLRDNAHEFSVSRAAKLEINNLYKKRKSRIKVVTSAAASEKAVADLRLELLLASKRQRQHGSTHILSSFLFLGFDTLRDTDESGPPMSIQLATENSSYIFPLTSPMEKSLQGILSDPSIIKVRARVQHAVSGLRCKFGADACGDGSSFLDLVSLAEVRWPNFIICGVGNLRNLTSAVLRCKLCKGRVGWGDTTKKELTRDMRNYASVADAFTALDMLSAIFAQSSSKPTVAPIHPSA